MTNKFPFRFYFGLALVVTFWFVSWTHLGMLSEYSFFPLWLGYIFTVDGLVAWRKGSSLMMRSPSEFLALFLLSTPAWWIFEFHNYFLMNWHYLGSHDISFLEMVMIGTIDFSTVVPAVFETAELIATFGFVNRFQTSIRMSFREQHLWLLMYIAVGLFAGVLFLPQYFFPFTWIWLFIFIDPLNYMRGRASLIGQAARGDYRLIVALACGVLICGFFWEMWNFFSFPKWYYTVPYFDGVHVFEMPLLGYIGYIPFAWELYSLYQFVWGIWGRPIRILTMNEKGLVFDKLV